MRSKAKTHGILGFYKSSILHLYKEDNLNQIIESNRAAFKVKIGDLERIRSELLAENQILKAKFHFAPVFQDQVNL